jgi:putative ABC transport system permease protein
MSSLSRQTRVMLRANILSLQQRLALSLSMVFSIALVVLVLAGFLSMAAGFERVLKGSGSAAVAVVLGGGARQETGSDIPPDTVRSILALGGDIGVLRDAGGTLVASREMVVTAAAAQGNTTLALRGMDPSGPGLRDGVTLSKGRLFAPGSREIVVGEGLVQQMPDLAIGDTLRLGSLDWLVVGYFAANGSAFESEIWADLDSLRAGFDRQGEVQTLRLRLTDPAAIGRPRIALATATAEPLTVLSEADLYAGQSGRTAALIRLFGWPLAALMAIGAMAGALNTMMSSVSERSTEIATLRALGFGRLPAFLATWAEAALLALLGSLIGVALSWAIFNGWQASTLGANNARMGFRLLVTGEVMRAAGLVGLAIGLIGGALPAIAATRLPLTVALRGKG